MTATPAVAVVHTTTRGGGSPSAQIKPLNKIPLRPCVASDLPSFSQFVMKTIATLSLVVAVGSCCAAAEGAAAGGAGTAAAAVEEGGGKFYLRSSSVPSTATAGRGRPGPGEAMYVRSCSAPSTAAFALPSRCVFNGQRHAPHRLSEAAQGTALRTITSALQHPPQQAFHSESWRSLDTTTNHQQSTALYQENAGSHVSARMSFGKATITTTTTRSKLMRCAGLGASKGGDSDHGAVRDRHGELVRQWGPPAVIRFEGVTKTYEKRRWFAPPVEVVALENTTLVLRGPGPFGLVGDSGAGKSTFLRLICGDALPSSGRVSIEALSAPKAPKVSAVPSPKNEAEKTPPEEGKAASPDQGSPIPDRNTPATIRGDRGRDQPGAGTSPRCGVSYLGRYWSEAVTIPPSQEVARVLADAFRAQRNPGKKPSQQEPSRSRRARARKVDGDLDSQLDGGLESELDGDDDVLTENLLWTAGLGDVRDVQCGDLRRGQLLVLVLCIGVARAVVTARQAAGSPSVGRGALTTTDQLVGPVLCLDEFLEMEDPRVRRGVEVACAGLCAAGVTIVFATHIMEHVNGMMKYASSTRLSPARNSASNSKNSFSNSGGGRNPPISINSFGSGWQAASGGRNSPKSAYSGFNNGGKEASLGGRNTPNSVKSFVSGGEAGSGSSSGGVVSFSRGRAGELSPVEESTYVKWKKGEAERRLARQII